ncbi:MAG: amino acid permease [Lentisphaerae bacterium]|nr:MAG: amino acid permease [Lentisphaerota bacterium]
MIQSYPAVKQDSKGYNFGTFKGVMMPSLLTILGVVMYMRFGWVLGQVGLVSTIEIVLLSTSITFLTGLSLSALATNMNVGGGGAYYIISRSLGLETGAAIGIPLYFAQATGVSFYIVGFTETLLPMVKQNAWVMAQMQAYGIPEAWLPAILGLTTLVLLTLLAYISADLALKSQFLIFTLILASLLWIFTGKPPECPPEYAAVANDAIPQGSFWVVFAVFFPAVTGIEAGIAMSGDLKNPAKSLPLGTLGAILISLMIYLAIPIFLNYHIDNRNWLIHDKLILTQFTNVLDLPHWLNIVLLAIWGASISSAMGSLLGAPRTLQALAHDRVIPNWIGKGFGKNNEPRIATGFTFLVAATGILLGNLNAIAPVLSMFFLTSYCTLNLSAAFEGIVASPSWRPRFRVPWYISLAGALGCIFVMIQINFIATIVAVIICSSVYVLMQRRSIESRWGDVRAGLLMLGIRNAIYALQKRPYDEKTWKPNIMVLTDSPKARWYLVHLADALSHEKGFLTIAAIDTTPGISPEELLKKEKHIREELDEHDVSALVKVHHGTHVVPAIRELVRLYGFGPIVPNTILLGDTTEKHNFTEYARLIILLCQLKKNIIMVREGVTQPIFNRKPEILIWWRGWTQFAAFKLAIAYLLTQSEDWQGARIVLKSIVSTDEEASQQLDVMKNFIDHTRLEAEAEVVKAQAGTTVQQTIIRESQGANIVFLGIRPPLPDEDPEDYAQYYENLIKSTEGLPPTLFTLNSEDVEFRRIFQ